MLTVKTSLSNNLLFWKDMGKIRPIYSDLARNTEKKSPVIAKAGDNVTPADKNLTKAQLVWVSG